MQKSLLWEVIVVGTFGYFNLLSCMHCFVLNYVGRTCLSFSNKQAQKAFSGELIILPLYRAEALSSRKNASIETTTLVNCE